MAKLFIHPWPRRYRDDIRDVKEAAHQLNYNDDTVLHLIKATMPSEIYGTLYNQHDLNTVVKMVKDIYAKKPEPANPPAAAGGAAAPFTLIKAPNSSSKRIHFQEGETLSDRIDKLTETLYRMDIGGSLPIFTLSTHRIKVGAKAYVKAKVPFVEKLSGHAIAKLLHKGSLGTMKIRLVDNLTVIQIINNTPSTMYLFPLRINRYSGP